MGGRGAGFVASRWWLVLWAAAGLGGVLLTYRDYGITWDEGVQAHYGELVVDYFRSGLSDLRCNEYLDLRYYGPLFEATAAAVYRLAGTHPYETRHFLIGLTTVSVLIGVLRLGRLWRDPWVTTFAGPILLMLPVFYGHAFNNSKDIPFACGFTWSMERIARLALAPGPAPRWREVLSTGLVVGLTLALRVGGVLLFPFAGLALCAGWLRHRQAGAAVAFAIAGRLLAIVAVAWAVMVAAWPWAHQGVFSHPLEALRVSADFAAVKMVRFGGVMVTSQDLPRSYLPWFLLITTPLVTLGLAAVGFAAGSTTLWRGPRSPEATLAALVSLWFLVPVAYVVVMQPVLYDGIRHVLFILPALALLAAVGAAWLRARVSGAGRRQLVTLALFVLISLPLRDLIVLHPYESSYFNSVVGKARGAAGRYDLDYWVSSYKEASRWINARALERGGPIRVLLAGNELCLPCFQEYQDPSVLVRLVNDTGIGGALPDGADYYVSTTRRGLAENFPDAPVVHTIGRDGAVFTVIKGHAASGGG